MRNLSQFLWGEVQAAPEDGIEGDFAIARTVLNAVINVLFEVTADRDELLTRVFWDRLLDGPTTGVDGDIWELGNAGWLTL